MSSATKLLDQIVAEPARAATVPADQVPALLVQLASVQAILLSRLAVAPSGSQPPPPPPDDRYLTAEEAGAILRRPLRRLYRHA
jgi:hypothetical protein